MSRDSKVGGTKRRVLDVVGFTAIIVLFLLYMVPFILVLLNSFKQKRDIIKNPFSFITEKGYTLLCTDGSIHDHSIPGDHDPVSFHLRFRASFVKPQTDTDLYAYRFCVEYVSIHLSGIYQERYPAFAGGGGISGWMYQCTDIFQDCISTVETDHSNPCDLKCTGILE